MGFNFLFKKILLHYRHKYFQPQKSFKSKEAFDAIFSHPTIPLVKLFIYQIYIKFCISQKVNLFSTPLHHLALQQPSVKSTENVVNF